MKSTKAVSFMNLFYAVQVELAERGRTEFEMGVNDPKWHKAYYEAKKQFPEAMEIFDVLGEEDPFVYGLEIGILDSFRAKHLVPVNDKVYRTEWVEGIKDKLSEVDNNVGEVAKYICDLVG